jgi:hypothetical protein
MNKRHDDRNKTKRIYVTEWDSEVLFHPGDLKGIFEGQSK